MLTLGDYSQIPAQLIYGYEFKKEWLLYDSRLHGVGHMTRVFILQELICQQLERQGDIVNRMATRWATSVHDVGRIDDEFDLEHGKRSVKWMNVNVPASVSPETLDIATYIVHWHVPHDDEAPTMTTELQVMKDADSLDRVRLGDLDESYLRTAPAKNMVYVAQQLWEASLPSNPNENESFLSVIKAAIKLGLVEP